ncbi:MAG: nucleotidyltransferase family protein [Flavipsychrobacter sp.]
MKMCLFYLRVKPFGYFRGMKAMLFAAGLGTRLKPFTDKHPKALAEVNGKTLLEHNIRYLQKYGITDVVVNVHHFADQIEKAIANNNGWGSNITVSDERGEVLETGGGLQKAATHFIGEDVFIVMNVDVLTNLDLAKMIAAHNIGSSIATLAVMQRESSRHLLFNKDMRLCGWQNNKTGEQKIVHNELELKGFAFSGVHVLSPEILDMPFEGKFSIIDIYLHFAKTDILQGYDHTGDIFLDVGKPESLKKAEELFSK